MTCKCSYNDVSLDVIFVITNANVVITNVKVNVNVVITNVNVVINNVNVIATKGKMLQQM